MQVLEHVDLAVEVAEFLLVILVFIKHSNGPFNFILEQQQFIGLFVDVLSEVIFRAPVFCS